MLHQIATLLVQEKFTADEEFILISQMFGELLYQIARSKNDPIDYEIVKTLFANAVMYKDHIFDNAPKA